MTTGEDTPKKHRPYEGKHAPHTPRGWLSTLSLGSKISIGAGLLAVIGLASLLLTFDGNPRDSGTELITRGVACPHLAEANRVHKEGDEIAFAESVAEAADAAEEALDTSGQVFGRPEQVAIELRHALEQDAVGSVVERWLEEGKEFCTQLRRWPRETTA